MAARHIIRQYYGVGPRRSVKSARLARKKTKRGSIAMRFFCLAAVLVLASLAMVSPAQAAPADGWITHPAAAPVSQSVVLHFRRVLDLKTAPKAMPVTVTADNRFVLFVNGRRIATGPSTGTITSWRTESIDLAPYLKRGPNVVAAVV